MFEILVGRDDHSLRCTNTAAQGVSKVLSLTDLDCLLCNIYSSYGKQYNLSHATGTLAKNYLAAESIAACKTGTSDCVALT